MQDLKKFLKTSDRFVRILNQEWIQTPKDFFYYFPKDYEDRTQIKKVSQLQEGVKSVVKVKVVDKSVITTPKWKKLIEFKLEDEDKNIIFANFLNTTYVLKQLKIGERFLLSWKPRFSYGKYVFWYPEILWWSQMSSSDETRWDTSLVGKIVPVYSDLMGIKWSWFQKKMAEKLPEINNLFEEFLPEYLLKKYNLFDIKKALKNIHFPENLQTLQKAKYRFNFEKLLTWQLVSNLNFKQKQINKPTSPNREIVKEFLKLLPFELTKAQKKAIKVIIDDMHSGKIMTRLLQWDVWSWKTIVSTIVAYYVIKQFWQQVAFLAPTEVLANQHIKNIAKYFLPLGLKIALLTGSTKPKEKEQIKQQIKNWEIDFVLWTHAIIQDDVIFKDLWLIIIDEQHKFWVNQRAKLASQWSPHILQMTATPIPRSLALAYFGEFENTIIDELPPGRQPVYTKVISESEFEQLKWFLLNKIQQGQQVYIVVPLIEESEKLEGVKSALEEYEEIKSRFEGEDLITDNWNKITDNKIEQKLYEINWVAMEIYNEYWYGLRESFYQEKMFEKLKQKWFNVKKEVSVVENWKLLVWKVDLLVDNEIVVELKSIPEVSPANFKQIRTYMKLWNYAWWTLINFWNKERLEYFVFKTWWEIKKSLWLKTDNLWLSSVGKKTIKVWLMHWKLRPDEKEKVMKDFKEWKTQVLVSTTVIEVWVDVPQATIMIIKNAERFGLAALHQLRWRVWRSDLKSYCFLVTKSKAGEAYRRLKYMEQYTDWFKLAEIDLKLRGPWTILWTQQSWQLDLPEEALKDIKLLEATRNEARYIVENNLLEKFPKLKEKIEKEKKVDVLKW